VKPQVKPNHTVKRTPPSPEQVRAEQIRRAEADTAKAKAALPVKAAPAPVPAVVAPDNRTPCSDI
jgi:hypothetical protein